MPVFIARAKQAVSQGKDLELPDIHICSVGGFTMEGEAPERYPVCGAHQSKFVIF